MYAILLLLFISSSIKLELRLESRNKVLNLHLSNIKSNLLFYFILFLSLFV